MSAVPTAPRIFFQTLSLSLAYPGFSEQCKLNSKTIGVMNRISNTACKRPWIPSEGLSQGTKDFE